MSQRAYIVILRDDDGLHASEVAEEILDSLEASGFDVDRVNPFGGDPDDTAGNPEPPTNNLDLGAWGLGDA